MEENSEETQQTNGERERLAELVLDRETETNIDALVARLGAVRGAR